MKIRADIAEWLRQGFNNAEIAQRAGVDPKTVAAARRRLQYANAPARRDTTALERLYAEAVPTGQVRDWKPVYEPLTPKEQADNRARLLAALRAA